MRIRAITAVLLTLSLPRFSFAQEGAGAAQEVSGFSLVQYEDAGEKRWNLTGKTAEVEGDNIRIAQVSAVIFGKETAFKVKSKLGFFNKEEHRVSLEDNVVIKATDGLSLRTDSLDWDTETKSVSTGAPVNIKRIDFEVDGRGAICDLDSRDTELKKDITASLRNFKREDPYPTRDAAGKPEKGAQDVTITCDGPLEIDYKKNRAIFRNNVKAENIRGNIFADRIDIYFKQGTTKVRCVAARGNVRIIEGKNVTYSEKAIYLVDRGRLVLPRKPKLVIQNEPIEQ